MNRNQAYELVHQTFTHAFDKNRFLNFIQNLLNHIDESKAASWNSQYVKDAFKGHVHRYERLGTYESPDKETVDILVVHLTKESKLERARTGIRNFVADHLKTRDEKDAGLVAFVSPTEKQWRFSYVKMEYATVEKDSGKVSVETRLTPARRFSYIVGEGESCHTAQSRFLSLLQETETDPKLADIEEAFSVEVVTKKFFARYAALFEGIHKALDGLVAKDKTIRNEFSAKHIKSVDFAKKLMGQIVFLYFLQKKGWLGVAKGQDWGSGPRDFLRRLANGAHGKYDNLFNDILEPLFYDTLATDRGHEAWCKHFRCRIPFLNGGLFEPLGDYDWRKTDIILPNKLFTNTEFIEEGITGTGVLDVFDRYNFTVNEAEPLEKEVAIDPEMLGKVFENLIEENRRKGLGTYYTPREIVYYMCRESLINYLETALKREKKKVAREDIETFVHLGEQAALYEAARVSGTKSYALHLPKSIESNAKLIDEKLADITICDPAVGSGAFPVGMMTEIVRARCALTPYFNDVRERTPYQFKRQAIQNCLHGVDIDPGAVEIAKLRLWLSLVVDEEETRQIKPLPNLDFKVATGNSLYGFPFRAQGLHEIVRLKEQYFDETDHDRKAELKRRIEQKLEQNFSASKKSLGYEVNFDFQTHFSEVFSSKGGFDAVLGNPPYGTDLTDVDKAALAGLYPEAKKKIFDVYNFFMVRGLQLTAPQGCLSFIVPPTWLNNKNSRALRRLLLQNGLYRLSYAAERVFETAIVDSVVFFTRKGQDTGIVRSYTVEQCRTGWSECLTNEIKTQELDVNAFLPREARADNSIVKKIKASSATKLGKVARIVFGIQTRKSANEPNYLHEEPVNKSCKRAVNGKNMGRYYVKPPNLFVEYGDWLWNKRDESIFKAPQKILVRQVGHYPICALDESQLYSLNTIFNVVVTDGRVHTRYVLALLDSLAIRYVWRHIFPEIKDVFPRVKKEQLVEIPIVLANEKAQKEIEVFVDQILAAKRRDSKADTRALEAEIDRHVYALYGLTEKEIAIVEDSLTASKRKS